MKVAVITRHAITNYGSLLQAMATQQVIEDLGHTCEIINYIRDNESYYRHEITILKRKPDWYNNPIKRMLYLSFRQPESIVAGKRFKKERLKYLKLSEYYRDADQLAKEKPVADVFMTGSDQVWGPVEDGSYDSSYCLSFTADNDKRIAFASSFGHTEMTDPLKSYYRTWLSRYRHIAVREDSAVEMLKDIGINALQVLDPTLLIDADHWKKYTMPISKRKYVLVYQIHNDKKLGEYAQRVSEAKRSPLVRISASFHQLTRQGKFVYAPELGKFLSYIQNAEFMVTDSFHGTAFALNFNIPFVEVLPNNNTGSRNMSILKLTGLSERILLDENDMELANKPVDFTNANQVIALKRKESLENLRMMIEE